MKWLIIALLAVAAILLWRGIAAAGDVPKLGDPAAEFSLPDQNGRTRSLGEFCNQWLVLYFYPKDDTPGCDEQAASFRDTMLEFEGLGAAVCGISVDDSASHAAFARKYNLPFALLADRGGATAARYGSIRDLGLIKFARRNTFLIDPQGLIAKVYLSANTSKNSQQVIDDLQALRSKN
jgi:peroxiredoxin Q/BCP